MTPDHLHLTLIEERLVVCRLAPDAPLIDAGGGAFWSATRTPDELSLVLPEALAPPGTTSAGPLRCFKVEGPLAFSLVGVLASLSATLARASVSLFTISTFDTDYLLVKEGDLDRAKEALLSAGHEVA